MAGFHLPNDQQADPGWRHIRILTSSDGSTLSSRARFCPWCGTCFREEPDAEGRFETIARVRHYGDASVVCFVHEAREVARWQVAASDRGMSLDDWLTRLATDEVNRPIAWGDEPDSVRPGPGDDT